jgi:hypothetical protein
MNKIKLFFLQEIKFITIILCYSLFNTFITYLLFYDHHQFSPGITIILSTLLGVSLVSLPYFLISVVMPFYERIERFFLYSRM